MKNSCLYIYLHEHHIKITLMKCKLPKEIVLRLVCRWYHVLFKLFLCSLGPAARSNIFRHSQVIWYFFQRQTLRTVLNINVIGPIYFTIIITIGIIILSSYTISYKLLITILVLNTKIKQFLIQWKLRQWKLIIKGKLLQ